MTHHSEADARKRVLIIYTGGTMGMKSQSDGGLAPEKGFLTAEIQAAPEFSNPEMPDYIIVEYEPLLDSSCMGPSDWSSIAKDIHRHYLDFDGFVVIMGTDTMAYTASALSFMLENLGKPVIFTGSQIPFCEVYNDARRNLVVSIIFATSDIPEVCINFHDKLLRANRSVKVNSVGLNAYDSPNFPPLATLGAFINERRELFLPQPRGPFKIHTHLEAKVVVLKLVPGFDDECVHALVEHSQQLRALVLELYGTGNGPVSSGKGGLMDAIVRARSKGIVVVAVSQCVQGGVSLDTYSLGLEYKRAGVVSGGDLTTEACTTKLAYLFGRGATAASIPALLATDMRGEITAVATQTVRQRFFGPRSRL